MTGGSTPQFEIPTDMRKMIDQCVEQVRTGITNYLQFLQRAVPGNVMGGSELSNKVLNYAERNLARAFEFAGKLAQVRDVHALATASGIHPSANPDDYRADKGLERRDDQRLDGQHEGHTKGWSGVLVPVDQGF
jgi:hypothetical protein